MSPLRGTALVMGLGSFGGGVGATRHLLGEGWEVCVTDLRSAEQLSASMEQLQGLPIRYVLGEHVAKDFQQADLVVASPAVAPANPWLELARENGARIGSEIELFLEEVQARLVLVTGTQGKSSTCHLLQTLLGAAGARVFLGGNIGVSLLGELTNLRPEDFVVLELSSYQLEALGNSPRLGQLRKAQAICVTNLVPDHLERHGSFEAYGLAKRQILKLLRPGGVALIGATAALAHWQPAGGTRLSYGQNGVDLCIKQNAFQRSDGTPLAKLKDLRLPGKFQQLNALAALGLAASLGISPEQLERALPGARGLEHRLEDLGQYGGVRVHDNGVSTTPDSTIAALGSLPRGVHLLMGGRSKGLPLAGLANAIRERAASVTLFGEARGELADALARAGVQATQFEDLAAAVKDAYARGAQASQLLFSPACSSFDAFPNFKARAMAFRSLLAAQVEPTKV